MIVALASALACHGGRRRRSTRCSTLRSSRRARRATPSAMAKLDAVGRRSSAIKPGDPLDGGPPSRYSKAAEIARRSRQPAVAAPALGRGHGGRRRGTSRRRPMRRTMSTSSISGSGPEPADPVIAVGAASAAPGRHRASRTGAQRSVTSRSSMPRLPAAIVEAKAKAGRPLHTRAICRAAAARQPGASRVSAWTKSSQSPVAAATPSASWTPRPRGAVDDACARLAARLQAYASVEPPSTTMISSASASAARQASRRLGGIERRDDCA